MPEPVYTLPVLSSASVEAGKLDTSVKAGLFELAGIANRLPEPLSATRMFPAGSKASAAGVLAAAETVVRPNVCASYL